MVVATSTPQTHLTGGGRSDTAAHPPFRDSGAPLQIRQQSLTVHRPPSSPNSPLQQLPSLLDVDQLRQQCHITRSNVTEDELVPQKRVELVHAVPWKESEESDYPTVLSCSSTSRKSAPADLGTLRYKPTSQADDRWLTKAKRCQHCLGRYSANQRHFKL